MISRKIRAYKLANPTAKAKEIAEVLGIRVNYVYQALKFKPKRVKKVNPVVEEKLTNGQNVLRKEIVSLNNELDKYKNLTKYQEDRINLLTSKVRDLKLHHSGLEYVISYLESRLGIENKDDGATV